MLLEVRGAERIGRRTGGAAAPRRQAVRDAALIQTEHAAHYPVEFFGNLQSALAAPELPITAMTVDPELRVERRLDLSRGTSHHDATGGGVLSRDRQAEPLQRAPDRLGVILPALRMPQRHRHLDVRCRIDVTDMHGVRLALPLAALERHVGRGHQR